ncbi:hypothetical protein AC578_1969 [Pseudocercospora eumusae]|uniref:C2H2-type domain-containing protein n=1 Tax=Pseudocercospora eumusae TaxID=321146 RepID=A0A139H250_9PEZI|nr:hypothetical protein AC578_1969 [Pseudocercospora eumusae]
MSAHISQEEFQTWVSWINENDWSAYNVSALDDDAAEAVSSKERLTRGRTSRRRFRWPHHTIAHASEERASSHEPESSNGSNLQIAKLALRCPREDCTYTKAFPRQYELDRHIATVHEKQKPFWCPVKGCFKSTAAPSFTRSDKLTSHIRACHKVDADTDCPVVGCPVTLELLLLGRHLVFDHHRGLDRTARAHANAVVNAASSKFRKCPLWQCSAQVPLSRFEAHLKSHGRDELECMAVDLAKEGYIIAFFDDSQEAAEIYVRCPVCSDVVESLADFEKHLLFSHITNPGWPNPQRIPSLDSGFYEGHWTSRIAMTDRKDRQIGLHCRGCGEDFADRHDCGIMRNNKDIVAELRPHRQALLRLCPAFGACEIVFEDLILNES